MVEFQPSKLAVAGSNPVSRSIVRSVRRKTVNVKGEELGRQNLHSARFPFYEIKAHVAQLAEHVLGKDEVTRSIRVVGSSLIRTS